MPRANPFLRRASSPGTIHQHNSENTKEHLAAPSLPTQPVKLPQASLSDPALKAPIARPSTFRNTQSRSTSIRPSRFIKATIPTSSVSSPIMPLDDTTSSTVSSSSHMGMLIRLFDTFTQKIYIEGYLMKHQHDNKKARTKMFVELSGSTLTLWDTELPGSAIMPTYLHITDTTTVYSSPIIDSYNKKKHIFVVQNNKAAISFETFDEPTMIRWVSAIRLCSFEKQKLHQLFTLRLLLPHASTSTAETKAGTFLQVRLPGSTIWQKHWVVLSEQHLPQRNKRFLRRPSYVTAENQQKILLYETKKSRTPLCSFSDISHAYAVYPESPQLIEKGSMIHVSGLSNKTQEQVECWFMADHSQLTIQWLLALYDTFKLYGRPGFLLDDASNPKALNFGEPCQDMSTTVYPKLFLETNDVIQTMVASSIPNQQIESIFLSAIRDKTQQTEKSERPAGIRANSLPLITVITPPDAEQPKEEEALPAPFKFARQIADSSDESSDEGEDEADDDEDQDSDDEPIGKKSINDLEVATEGMSLSPTANKSFADNLIPDFDFGNGFDVPKNIMAAAVSASQTLPTRGSRQQGSRHRSSMTLFTDPASERDQGNSSLLHKRKASMPITTASTKERSSSFSSDFFSSNASLSPPTHVRGASSSLFGDFSLTTNFDKFLDEPLDYHRKFSLPFSPMESNSRSTSSSNQFNEWEDLEDEETMDNKSSQQPYHNEDDQQSLYELNGPMIPSLGDHFAPQNSLLDTYLGDQLSAKEQIEYAKATGQPLIQVSTKKEISMPQGGLVGMISQREKDRKEGTGLRVAERVNKHHAQQDRFEREKELMLLEQRQQQIMKHQMMLYANGFGVPPMPAMHPHPFMMNPMPITPLNMAMLHQQSTNGLCLTPQQYSPMIHSAPSSPYRNGPIRSPPLHSPTMGYFGGLPQSGPGLTTPTLPQGRKFSRPLLDGIEELSTNRKSPVASTSSGTSSIRI
ncbi:hypothetical protein CU098_005794, partial [Rhizopus stolonifer]